MRVIALFSLCFIALVAYTSAQGCVGSPRTPNCVGGRNDGRGGNRCVQRNMYYWNGRTCEPMRYRGCGGNNNRWCTRAACERRCRRS